MKISFLGFVDVESSCVDTFIEGQQPEICLQGDDLVSMPFPTLPHPAASIVLSVTPFWSNNMTLTSIQALHVSFVAKFDFPVHSAGDRYIPSAVSFTGILN